MLSVNTQKQQFIYLFAIFYVYIAHHTAFWYILLYFPVVSKYESGLTLHTCTPQPRQNSSSALNKSPSIIILKLPPHSSVKLFAIASPNPFPSPVLALSPRTNRSVISSDFAASRILYCSLTHFLSMLILQQYYFKIFFIKFLRID